MSDRSNKEQPELVPQGMLKAAREAGVAEDGFTANNLQACLAAALQWLRTQPSPAPLTDVERVVSGHSRPHGLSAY